MPRWVGLLGSWALLVLALGVLSIAAAGEWINLQDAQRLHRLAVVDRLIEQRSHEKIEAIEKTIAERAKQVGELQSQQATVQKQIEDLRDSKRTVVVSTAENKVYLREGDSTLFEAACSTGKGTTLIDNGRTMVFETPIGKFRIRSKEENPVWVPPDWHYVEQGRKEGMQVVRMGYRDQLDADTGGPVRKGSGAVWSWLDSDADRGTQRILKVQGKDVVVVENGSATPLPPGQLITAGKTLVIPPVGTHQREFDKVLGSHRLNLGDGYALHGTQAVDQLGRSVSHGCVRLSDQDISRLYDLTQVGDEVIIY